MFKRFMRFIRVLNRSLFVARIVHKQIDKAHAAPNGVGAMRSVFVDESGNLRALYFWMSTDPGGAQATVCKLRLELEAAKDVNDELMRRIGRLERREV